MGHAGRNKVSVNGLGTEEEMANINGYRNCGKELCGRELAVFFSWCAGVLVGRQGRQGKGRKVGMAKRQRAVPGAAQQAPCRQNQTGSHTVGKPQQVLGSAEPAGSKGGAWGWLKGARVRVVATRTTWSQPTARKVGGAKESNNGGVAQEWVKRREGEEVVLRA